MQHGWVYHVTLGHVTNLLQKCFNNIEASVTNLGSNFNNGIKKRQM